MSKTKYKQDLTIVMLYHNVEFEYFKPSIESVLKFNIPVIIYNDNCDYQFREQLFFYKDNPLLTIIDSKYNSKQPTATYNVLKYVKTKYIMRVDSDDILVKLPETEESDFDMLIVKKKLAINLYRFLIIGGSPNGCIIKTTLMQYMYKDHLFMSKNVRWFHEDAYALFTLFLYQDNYKIIKSDNIKCYKRVIRPVSECSNKAAIKHNLRLETLKIVMMRDPNFFIEDFLVYDIAIRGLHGNIAVVSQGIINRARALVNIYGVWDK